MKFAVVPESSERLTGVIAVSGRSASGLSAAIAGSFQVVIFWSKIPATVSGESCSSLTLGQVVDDRDRGDVDRDLDQLATLVGAALLGALELAALERRVGAAVLGAAGDELLAAAAGADRVVGDRDVRALVLDPGDPGFLGRLLGARAGAGDLARERGVAAAAVAAGAAVVAAAGGDAEGQQGNRRGDCEELA